MLTLSCSSLCETFLVSWKYKWKLSLDCIVWTALWQYVYTCSLSSIESIIKMNVFQHVYYNIDSVMKYYILWIAVG
jgi:hypothetical protein